MTWPSGVTNEASKVSTRQLCRSFGFLGYGRVWREPGASGVQVGPGVAVRDNHGIWAPPGAKLRRRLYSPIYCESFGGLIARNDADMGDLYKNRWPRALMGITGITIAETSASPGITVR